MIRHAGWLTLVVLLNHSATAVTPDQLEFRRQAVRRMVFDRSQDIPLAGLWPAKVVGLDVMHPPVGEQVNPPRVTLEQGRLRIAARDANASATRWVGGFNPFAVYDVAVNEFQGSGEVGVMFRDGDAENQITATLVAEDSAFRAIRTVVVREGDEVHRQEFALPEALAGKDPIRLRVQMLAVGANLFVERAGQSTLIGEVEIVEHVDLRQKELMRRFEFCLHSSLEPGASVVIDEATAALSPGCGQADIRAITYKDGSPFWEDDRLWFTMTLRGRHGGWPMQGVFSLNPSVFDLQFEGLIVFDREDGLLRNELASHLFYDKEADEWRGMTVGFSYAADPSKQEKKQLWAVSSKRDPRFGFSIMKAEPLEMPGASEDPCVIYDPDAGKWRVLVCAHAKGFPATLYEADRWDGPYTRIAGPVGVDSTGCQLQKFGGDYYALIGSADRKMYIYSYPDLQPAGELKVHRPPWGATSNTRVWPTVVPLPEGYPAPYILLTMDRSNFPGMPTPSWTYGAMYLYHGHPEKVSKNLVQDVLRSGPMVGHTTHTSCRIWAHAGEGKRMELSYRPALGEGEDWRTMAMLPRSERNFSAVAALDDLEPLTTYRYRIAVENQRAAEGQFATAPPPDRPAAFRYAITSCMDVTRFPEQPAWDAVIEQEPDFHLLVGDNVYANSTDRNVIWRYHLDQRSLPNFSRLLATVPNYATWDDHDYGPNDAHGLTPGKENSLEAFKDLWANPSYGTRDLPGVFYTYRWGNVQFIVLDDRYYRTDERAANTPGKTQFGEAQREWLFGQLESSRSPFKVVVTGYDIMGARYPEEIGFIARFIRDHEIYGVLFHSGDIHRNEFKQQDHGMGYPVCQITSSGIAKNDNRPWTMVDVNTTLDDPTLTARFYSRESLDTTQELSLSMLTPPGVSDLILNSPVGGERWGGGNTHTILWTRVGGGIDKVKLEYDTGAGWTPITSSAPNTGRYTWSVPAEVSARARVRVSSEDGTRGSESREPFAIVKAGVEPDQQELR